MGVSEALLLLASAAAAATCTTDEGCSFNGKCRNGVCHCLPQWKGPRCASLNLIPTARTAGLQDAKRPAGLYIRIITFIHCSVSFVI